MRQEDAITEISERVKLVKSDVRLVITALNEVIVEALLKGDDICLTGIGKIRPVIKKGRLGRNPKTGEALIIPDKTNIKLTLAKSLKELLKAQG